jgi:hypothetical protein
MIMMYDEAGSKEHQRFVRMTKIIETVEMIMIIMKIDDDHNVIES